MQKITYLNDNVESEWTISPTPPKHSLEIGDILVVKVLSFDEETTNFFNVENNVNSSNSSMTSANIYLNGFTISSSFEKIISWNDRKGPNRSREIFILKFSRSKEEDGEFAFNYNPVNAHESSLSYSKNINGFDFSINHNQIFEDSLKYDTSVEVSSTF